MPRRGFAPRKAGDAGATLSVQTLAFIASMIPGGGRQGDLSLQGGWVGGWGHTQLKVHLKRLEELEYLLIHRGGRGQSFVYELLYEPPPDAQSRFLARLIDVEQLRRQYDGTGRGSNGQKSGGSRGQVGPKSGPSRGRRIGASAGRASVTPASD